MTSKQTQDPELALLRARAYKEAHRVQINSRRRAQYAQDPSVREALYKWRSENPGWRQGKKNNRA